MRFKRVHVSIKRSDLPENNPPSGFGVAVATVLLISRVEGAMYQAKIDDGLIASFFNSALSAGSYSNLFDLVKRTVTCHYEERD